VIQDGGAPTGGANTITPSMFASAAISLGATMLNGTIVPSVAGNALTLAVKTLARHGRERRQSGAKIPAAASRLERATADRGRLPSADAQGRLRGFRPGSFARRIPLVTDPLMG
jgi:hypothetical protein